MRIAEASPLLTADSRWRELFGLVVRINNSVLQVQHSNINSPIKYAFQQSQRCRQGDAGGIPGLSLGMTGAIEGKSTIRCCRCNTQLLTRPQEDPFSIKLSCRQGLAPGSLGFRSG